MGAGALIQDAEPANAERQRWLALAEKALGRRVLRGKAGLAYRRQHPHRTALRPLHRREPIVRADPASPWIVSQRVDDPDSIAPRPRHWTT